MRSRSHAIHNCCTCAKHFLTANPLCAAPGAAATLACTAGSCLGLDNPDSPVHREVHFTSCVQEQLINAEAVAASRQMELDKLRQERREALRVRPVWAAASVCSAAHVLGSRDTWR